MKILSAILLALLVAGCTSRDQAAEKKLAEGKLALDQKNFDTAIQRADSILQSKSSNVDSAAAHYLRGRALEQRPKQNQAAFDGDMQLAKTNYNRALQLAPPKNLEGYIRTSLGSVNFYQGDYSAAYEEYSKAYDKLAEPEIRSGALYRIGVCQQRLGYFDRADKTFIQVQSEFPGSHEAGRAKERQGARGFQVQLATFRQSKDADTAIADLRKQGIIGTKTIDPRGLAILRVGPMSTYAEALGVKNRFAKQYPDSIILP